MSEKFTASNGVEVSVTREGIDTYLLGKGGVIPGGERRWTVATGNKDGMQALREFFLHERDQELGRWRDPELPHFYVVSDERGQKVVVDERDSRWSPVTRELIEKFPDLVEPHEVAARYYAAHPLPKPWHDAKPGEVWAITTENVADEAAVQVTPEGTFQYNDGNAWLIADMPIVSARRIWPEAVES